MGYEIHTAFERCEEWRAARMSEVEFVEAARALKALAAEHGIATGPVIDSLADKGLHPTLDYLASQSGAQVKADYYRHRGAAAQ